MQHSAAFGSAERSDHVGRRLHELDQHSGSADRRCRIALRMDEAHVVACRALADAARRKADPLLAQPLHRCRKVVDPKADVIQRRLGVDLGLGLGQPLPQVHSRQAADITRRVMVWASQYDLPEDVEDSRMMQDSRA